MDNVLEITINGVVLSGWLEWAKGKDWFPPWIDDKVAMRLVVGLMAVVNALAFGVLNNSLDFSTIEGIRAFTTHVVSVYGAEVVAYYGIIKK